MPLFLRILLLACALASADVAATARDDGFDARPHALVTTRGTGVRVTVWSPPRPPVLMGQGVLPRVAPDTLRPPPPRVPLEPVSVVHVVVPPRAGSVRVDGHDLVYTPMAGFGGRDQLTYSLTGNGRTTSALVTIDVGDPLLLTGQVVDGSGGAQVSATVGGHVFSTTADANGDYRVDVIGLPESMVALESRSGHVVLGSLVGGFQRLRKDAGADAELTRDENGLVQLSGVSTALAELLVRANKGRPVASDSLFRQLLGRYDAGTLLDMAGAIRLVADGGQPLPAGVADTQALISSPQILEAFAAALPADLLYEAVRALVEDPALLAPMRAADVPGERSILSPSVNGELRMGVGHGWRMSLEADGAGHFNALYPTGDDGVSWTLAGGVLQVRFDRPQYTGTFWRWVDGRSVRSVDEFDRLDLRPMIRGGASGRDLYAVTVHGRTRFPDDPGIPDLVSAGTSARMLHLDGAAVVPYGLAEIPGVRALPRHGAGTQPGVGDTGHGTGYALHQFNANGTGIVASQGAAFTWTLDDAGTLELRFVDRERVQVRRILRDRHRKDGVIATFHLPDGSVKSKFDVSSVRDGSLAFTVANLAHAWRSAFDVTEPLHQEWTDFHVLLDGPAQTGHTRSRAPGSPPLDTPLSWQIVGGAMVARHYRDWSGPRTRCTPGVNGCYLRQERRWIPVSASGDRIHLLEELWTDTDGVGPGSLVLMSQRGNFYQRVENPGP